MIYFFYGDEEFNISNEIKKLRSGLDSNFAQMNFKTFDNPKFPDLITAISTAPMMFGKMLVVIDCIKYFTSKKSGDSAFDDDQYDRIKEALDNCNENTDVVFVAVNSPDGKKKVLKTVKFFKLLSKYSAKEFPSIKWYKTDEWESWIKTQAKDKGLNINSNGIKYFLNQVGQNMRLLNTELDKLKIYALDKPVTKEMIKEICVSNEDLFNFTDLILSGDKANAIAEYNKLLMTTHPLSILMSLHTTLHKKIELKSYSLKYSPDEIGQMLKVHPYKIKMDLQAMKNIPLKELVKLKKNLTSAEYKIKSGGSNLSPEKEIEYAILQ